MNLKVKVQQNAALRTKLSKLSGLSSKVLFRAGDDVADWLRQYHRSFRLKWRGPRYMAGPASDFFWQQVVDGWQDPVVSGKKVTVTNTFSLLNWKVTGGTITPKNARMLTIPLVPDAKGLTAQQFEIIEQTQLFRVGNALMRRIGGQLEAIYALKASVTQAPWPGAMPDTDDIKAVFIKSVRGQIF